MRRCTIFAFAFAIWALSSQTLLAAPLVISAGQVAAGPRSDGATGICATAVHLDSDNLATSTAAAQFYLSQMPGTSNVLDRISVPYGTINFVNGDPGAVTDYSSPQPMPFSSIQGTPRPGNDRDVVMRVRGYLNVPRPGTFTLGVYAKDGYGLAIAGTPILQSTVSGVALRDSRQVQFPAAGLYPIELIYFQTAGGPAVLDLAGSDGANAEVTASPAPLPGGFQLVPGASLFSALAGQSNCTECTGDSACGTNSGSYCRDGLCQACVLNSRCGASCQPCAAATPECVGMQCVECSSSNTSVCDARYQICDHNRCRACAADSECGANKVCDTAFGQCIPVPPGQFAGGCDASRGGPAGAGLLLCALGLLLALRGRRDRQRRRGLVAGLVLAITAALPVRVAAQTALPGGTPGMTGNTGATGSTVSLAGESPNFNTQTFRPAIGPGNVFTVEGTLMPRSLWPMGGVVLEYANQPLRYVLDNGTVYATTVPYALTAHLLLGGGITRYLSAGVDLPLVLYQGYDARTPGSFVSSVPSAGGVGDLRLVAKIRILDNQDGGFGLAAVPQLTLPTGAADSFRGDGTFGIEPRLSADYRFRNGTFIALNVGYWIRTYNRTVDFGLVRVTDQFRYGVGAGVPIKAGVSLAGEITGAASFSKLDGGPFYATLEGLIGARYTHRTGIEVTAGGGGAFVSAVGTPNFRLFAGVGYVPRAPRRVPVVEQAPEPVVKQPVPPAPVAEPVAPPVAEPAPPPTAEPVPPVAAEPVPPVAKPAPPAAEPVPPPAPETPPEDKDTDQDGVPDKLDKCPDQGGPSSNNGCPLVVFQDGEVTLGQPIRFRPGVADIDAGSVPVIVALVKIVKGDPGIKKVVIQVSAGGDRKAAKNLAGRRAQTLGNALFYAGVPRKQIQVKAAGAPGGDEVTEVKVVQGKGKAARKIRGKGKKEKKPHKHKKKG